MATEVVQFYFRYCGTTAALPADDLAEHDDLILAYCCCLSSVFIPGLCHSPLNLVTYKYMYAILQLASNISLPH